SPPRSWALKRRNDPDFAARPAQRATAGSGTLSMRRTCSEQLEPLAYPSCPRIARRKTRVNALVSRASTSLFRRNEDVDGRAKPGHDARMWFDMNGAWFK